MQKQGDAVKHSVLKLRLTDSEGSDDTGTESSKRLRSPMFYYQNSSDSGENDVDMGTRKKSCSVDSAPPVLASDNSDFSAGRGESSESMDSSEYSSGMDVDQRGSKGERSDAEDSESPSESLKLEEHSYDPIYGPHVANENVARVLESWEGRELHKPDAFLFKLLEKRGYDSRIIPAQKVRAKPTKKQLDDYTCHFLDAVRLSDTETIKELHKNGTTMNACNKFGESILHHACRRADFRTVELLLDLGGDINVVDDYGRTPIHDACWRSDSRFDIVTILLTRELDLLRRADIRGACPLSYIPENKWRHWCAYFFHQKDNFWAHSPIDRS